VPAGLGDARLQVVWDNDASRTRVELQRSNVRAQPGGQILTPRGFGVKLPAAPEPAHKRVRMPGAARLSVDDRHRVAGEVDEHALASGVLQAHDDILASQPAL